MLGTYGLTAMDLAGDLEALHKRLALEASAADVDAAFKRAAALVNEAVDAAKPAAEAADASLGKTAEATRAGLQKELAKLKDRVVRAEKRNQDVLRGHLDKAQAGALPRTASRKSASLGPGVRAKQVRPRPLLPPLRRAPRRPGAAPRRGAVAVIPNPVDLFRNGWGVWEGGKDGGECTLLPPLHPSNPPPCKRIWYKRVSRLRR